MLVLKVKMPDILSLIIQGVKSVQPSVKEAGLEVSHDEMYGENFEEVPP